MKERDLNIEDYANDLNELCLKNFRGCRKCKDHSKLCALKKLAWKMAKMKYSRELKKGGKL